MVTKRRKIRIYRGSAEIREQRVAQGRALGYKIWGSSELQAFSNQLGEQRRNLCVSPLAMASGERERVRVHSVRGSASPTQKSMWGLEARRSVERGQAPWVEAYLQSRQPARETKSRKKGGSVRQVPRGVTTKRGVHRVTRWIRDGVRKGRKDTSQGSKKALLVERGVLERESTQKSWVGLLKSQSIQGSITEPNLRVVSLWPRLSTKVQKPETAGDTGKFRRR